MRFCVCILKVKFKAISKTFFFFLSVGQHQKRTHLLMTEQDSATERQKADERDIKRFNYAIKHANYLLGHLLFIRPDFSPGISTHKYNCLLGVSSWISCRHFQLWTCPNLNSSSTSPNCSFSSVHFFSKYFLRPETWESCFEPLSPPYPHTPIHYQALSLQTIKETNVFHSPQAIKVIFKH